MRLLILIITVSLSLNGCANDKTKVNSSDSNQSTSEPLKLNGAWVLKDYTKEIEKTNSPLKSSEKLKGLVSFYIGAISQNDSFTVDGSWNNHEGISFTIYFKKAQKPTHLKTNLQDSEEPSNYFELGLDVIDKETVLTLFHYNKSNQLLDSKQFTKVLDKQNSTDPNFGLQNFVNQKIISGNYTMTDDKGVKSSATFSDDGTLTGLSGFKNYYISTDFLGGPTPTFDEIILDINLQTMKSFILKKEDNALDFFTTTGDEDVGTLKPNKLKYHLVKL